MIGVYPGPIDADMAKDLPFDKTSPDDVATAILDAVESGNTEVYPDPFAQDFGSRFNAGPAGFGQYVAEMVSGGGPA